MAGIRKTKTKSGKIQAWFKHHTGKRKWFYSSESPKRTKERAIRLEEEHRQIRMGHRPMPLDTAKFLKEPIMNIIEKYFTWGNAQGGRNGFGWSKKHALVRRQRLLYWVNKLSLDQMSDLAHQLESVEAEISNLRQSGKAPKTVSDYVETLRSFINWCIKRGFLSTDPLLNIAKMDKSPIVQRRAMTMDEIKNFLKAAPKELRLSFEVALFSGLRAKELLSLRGKHLDMVKNGVWLEAAWTKNRKGGFQPLPPHIAEKLRVRVDQDDLEKHLLYVPSHPAREFDKVLVDAGIPKSTPEGKIDFHAARTAYVTFLFECGVNAKDVQTLARHSDPRITANTYARSRPERLSQAVASLGNLLNPDPVCATGVLRDNTLDDSTIHNPLDNNELECVENGGGGRIRTHETFRTNGFQDRRDRPLCHSSNPTNNLLTLIWSHSKTLEVGTRIVPIVNNELSAITSLIIPKNRSHTIKPPEANEYGLPYYRKVYSLASGNSIDSSYVKLKSLISAL